MNPEEFARFLEAVRAGDEAAGDELARRFEPSIRRVVLMRLQDQRLRRVLDASDVCQSVLRRFLEGARAGRFALDTPEELAALLVRMTINRIITVARRTAREAGTPPPEWDTIDSAPPPLQNLLREELAAAARQHLTPGEWALFEAHHLHRRGWADIAAEWEQDADRLRMRLVRALARVRALLEEEEARHVP